MTQGDAVDQVALLEAEALVQLLELGGKRVFVAMVVAEDDGDCTVTTVPSADTTATHVRGFAAGLQREAERLHQQLRAHGA